MNHDSKIDHRQLSRLVLLTGGSLAVALLLGSWRQLVDAADITAWLLVIATASGLVATLLEALARLARCGYCTYFGIDDGPPPMPPRGTAQPDVFDYDR